MLGVGSIPSHYHWAQAARKWIKNHGMERRHLESLNWNAEAYKDRQQQDTISLSGNDFWRPSRQWQGFTLLVAPAKWIRLILAGSLYPKSFPLKSTILEGCWGLRKIPTSFAASFRDARIYCTALSIWPPSFLLPRKSRMGVKGWWKVEKLEPSGVNWLETDSRAISSQVPL